MIDDLKVLLQIPDRIIAEDIQSLLEESGIFSIVESDNPASSVMNIYTGFNALENLSVLVNKKDFEMALEVINSSPYKNLPAEE